MKLVRIHLNSKDFIDNVGCSCIHKDYLKEHDRIGYFVLSKGYL